MCGVVGFIGSPSKVNRQIFKDMLMLDTRRGPHSTGVAVASKKTAYTLKSTQLPWDLAATEDFQTEIMGKNWPVMMGHNRHATLGAVNNDNAHPFWHDHIILTHNGTLSGLYRLDESVKYDTDSEVFAYNVAKNGIEDTYNKAGGAMTCVWWDQNSGRLNALSNGQRPFCFVFSKDKRTMYYASEEWMFRLACEARGVKLDPKWYTLADDIMLEFYQTRKGIVDYYSKKLKPFVVPAGQHHLSAYGYGSGGWEYSDDNDETWPHYLKGENDDPPFDADDKTTKLTPKSFKASQVSQKEHGMAHELIPNENTWKLRFGNTPCILCSGDMADEHKTALLIDCETVACGDCHTMCKTNHIELV